MGRRFFETISEAYPSGDARPVLLGLGLSCCLGEDDHESICSSDVCGFSTGDHKQVRKSKSNHESNDQWCESVGQAGHCLMVTTMVMSSFGR